MSNVKNYSEQGGDKTVIGGTLEITTEGNLVFEGTEFRPALLQQDSVATTVEELKVDFNALLLKLKQAGIMLNE